MKATQEAILTLVILLAYCLRNAFGLCVDKNYQRVTFISCCESMFYYRYHHRYANSPECCDHEAYELHCTNLSDMKNRTGGDSSVYGFTAESVDTSYLQNNSFPYYLHRILRLRIEHTQLEEILPHSMSSFDNLEEIHLAHNKISRIKNKVFTDMKYLEILDLSYNNITCIPVEAFNGNEKLKQLYLNNNKISQITVSVFSNITSLMTLDLSNNPVEKFFISQIASDCRENEEENDFTREHFQFQPQTSMFPVLENIEVLNLTNTNLDSTSYGIFLSRCGPNLTHVYLGENRITEINLIVFGSLYSLRTLNMSYNQIHLLQEEMFVNKLHLSTLLLNNNNIKTLTDSLFGSLKLLSYLDLSNNPISHIGEYFLAKLSTLNNLKMTNISMNDNNVFFLKHIKTTNLNISHNYITKVDNMFSSDNQIRTIDLSFNAISYLANSSFANIKNLENVHLGNNQIYSIPNSLFSETARLNSIDLSSNPIKSLSLAFLERIEELQELYIDSLDIDVFSFGNSTNVRKTIVKLSMRVNRLTNIDSQIFSGCESLSYLDMSYNLINSIDKDAFHHVSKLTTFKIQSNRLKAISSTLFKDSVALKYLDLSENEITNLNAGTFDGCQNLVVLNLSHNHLQNFNNFHTYSLKHLQELYLEGNRINNVIDAKYLPNLKKISLRNNPWSCDKLLVMLENLDRENISVNYDQNTPISHHIRHISCDHEELTIPVSVYDRENHSMSDSEYFKNRIYDVLTDMNKNFKNMLDDLRKSHNDSKNLANHTENSNLLANSNLESIGNLLTDINANLENISFAQEQDFEIHINKLIQVIDNNFEKMLSEINISQAEAYSEYHDILKELQNSRLLDSDTNNGLSSKLVFTETATNNFTNSEGSLTTSYDRNLKSIFYVIIFFGSASICTYCVQLYFKLAKNKTKNEQEEHQLLETKM